MEEGGDVRVAAQVESLELRAGPGELGGVVGDVGVDREDEGVAEAEGVGGVTVTAARGAVAGMRRAIAAR